MMRLNRAPKKWEPPECLVPQGRYHVDAEALAKARRGVPTGEYHRPEA